MLFTAICNRQRYALKNRQSAFWFLTTSTEGRSANTAKHLRAVAKTLRVMQLTAAILLFFTMSLSARVTSQTITFSGTNVPLAKVFSVVEKQTGFVVMGTGGAFNNSRQVTIHANKMELPAFLQRLLSTTNYVFEIKSKTIFIKEKTGPTPDLGPVENNDRLSPPIKGIIRDVDGNPLAGVNIVVKGTKRGLVSDAYGHFSIEADINDVLVISSVGYGVKEIKVSNLNDVLVVALNKGVSELDEVQYIAYGTTSRRLNTGNVSSVKAVDIEKQPVNNPLLALQGRVPGIFLEQSTGFAGTGVKVLIQGRNSITNGNDPLYVVDGVPFSSQLAGSLGFSAILGSSGTMMGSPFSYINPGDIESIDILKDADATAIYGSRAANGAILITTKKGKAGNLRVDVNVQSGIGKVGRKLDLLNTEQYIAMRKEAFKNDSIAWNEPPYTTEDYSITYGLGDINGFWDTTRYTDWQKELIGGSAEYSNVGATVSGGNSNTQFRLAANYHRETTVFPGDLDDKKASLHFSLNSSSVNQKFRLQFSGGYLADNNLLPTTDLTGRAMSISPNAPALYNPDGSLNWSPYPISGYEAFDNPLRYLYSKYQNKANNLLANAVLSYQLLSGLDLKSSFGFNRLQTNEKSYSMNMSLPVKYWGTRKRTVLYGNNNTTSWNIEPQLVFHRTIGAGQLEVLAGMTIQQSGSNGLGLNTSGYTSDQVQEDIKSATKITVSSASESSYKYNALFGRINYNWENKYILSVNARRDGSSRFGDKNRFHNFGSAAIAWLFSNETFIKDKLLFLSSGKWRTSYGTTGNDQIGDYQFLSLYNSVITTVPYQGAIGYAPSGLTNPYLQWEETKKLSVSLDLGFLKDRILFSATYFRNRSSNQLLGYKVSSFTGFNFITKNFPATVQNSGWEITLAANIINTRNFNWSGNFNITVPKNKLVAFPELATSSYSKSMFIGKPTRIVQAYHSLGVNTETGVYQFADRKGEPVVNPIPSYYPDNDATILINPDPVFYGGIQNSFSYKGISLDFLFYFVKQVGQNYLFGDGPGFGANNQPAWVLDRWQKPGDIALLQRYSVTNYDLLTSIGYLTSSDAVWTDASYIRLKNVSLSWQLPDAWMKKMHMLSSSLYIHGQNLVTFTNYKGLDPETKSSVTMPVLRVITVGLKIGI